MDTDAVLRRDHRIVLGHVADLEAALEILEDGNRKRARDRLHRAAAWFLSDLVRQLESRSTQLYGKVIESGGPAAEAVRHLQQEHDETHGLIDALRSAMGDEAPVDDIRRAARSLCAHLREHCWKEENLLLPKLASGA